METATAVMEEPKKTAKARKRVEAEREPESEPPRERYFYSRNGAQVIPLSEFGLVRKS